MSPRLLLPIAVCFIGLFATSRWAAVDSAARIATPGAGVDQATPAPPSAWTTQWGGFNYLVRMQAVSADSVWAVGSNAVHFDGRRWLAVDRRDYPGSLGGVSVNAEGAGWIAGGNEVIPIQADAAGTPETIPGYGIHDVAVVDGNDAWAVAEPSGGGPATILHYHSGTWSPAWVAPDGFARLESIWMASASAGWAVGTTAVYYNGETWTEWPLPIQSLSLREVRGSGPHDVWAVGGMMPLPLLDPRRVIVHFDGQGWSVERDETAPGIWSLAVRGDEGYAVDVSGEVFVLREGHWVSSGATVPSAVWPQVPTWVYAVSFVPGTDYALAATDKGLIYRLRGDEVTLVRDAGAFGAVAMLSDHLGWALGRQAMEYDGSTWHELVPGADLHRAVDITTVDGREAWAVGGEGLVLRRQAADWQRVAAPATADLVRVSATESGSVWVLGATVTEPGPEAESTIWGYSDTDGWHVVWQGTGVAQDLAVGAGQALVSTSLGIWHFDGTLWRPLRTTGALAIGIGPAGELWAGDRGEIQEYDGTAWITRVWLPGRARVRRFGSGIAATWAVADYGIVAAYVDGTWHVVRGNPDLNGHSGAMYDLRDISAVTLANGQVGLWAVGAPDTILHAVEGEVLGLPAITPAPTHEPYPTWEYRRHIVFLPRVDRLPAYRAAACIGANSLPTSDIEQAVYSAGRYYAAGQSAPDPAVIDLTLDTTGALSAEHGAGLVGAVIGGRRLEASTCIWWATLTGRFVDEPTSATPSSPERTWSRLDLALFPDDASILYEAFSGSTTEAAPTATPSPIGPLPPTAHPTARP